MKKYLIMLIVMVVLFAMPVLAKPMVMVTSPLLDDGFMLDELSEEDLTNIIGQVVLSSILGLDSSNIIIIENTKNKIILEWTDYYYNEDGSYIKITWHYENGEMNIVDIDYYPPVHPKN